VAAVSAVSSTSEAQAELVKYQQKLATDLAARAAAKVITADKEAVTKARLSVQQSQQSAPAATSTTSSTVDVTV
jgi:UDP-N-acetylglucosamine transferase subunit ALG13